MTDTDQKPPRWPAGYDRDYPGRDYDHSRLNDLEGAVGHRDYYDPARNHNDPAIRHDWIADCQAAGMRLAREAVMGNGYIAHERYATQFLFLTLRYVVYDITKTTIRNPRPPTGPADGNPTPPWPGNITIDTMGASEDTTINSLRDIVYAIGLHTFGATTIDVRYLTPRTDYLRTGMKYIAALEEESEDSDLHTSMNFLISTVDYAAHDIAEHTLRTMHANALKGTR